MFALLLQCDWESNKQKGLRCVWSLIGIMADRQRDIRWFWEAEGGHSSWVFWLLIGIMADRQRFERYEMILRGLEVLIKDGQTESAYLVKRKSPKVEWPLRSGHNNRAFSRIWTGQNLSLNFRIRIRSLIFGSYCYCHTVSETSCESLSDATWSNG